jgi:hypothetical protein
VSFGVDGLAVDGEPLFLGIDLRAELANDGAVDADAAGSDEFLAMPPRADAGVGQDLL